MDINNLLMALIIGALAGWLASSFIKGKAYGIVGNIIVGIIGAVIGGYIFNFLGIRAAGLVGSLITATVGATVLLQLMRLIKRA